VTRTYRTVIVALAAISAAMATMYVRADAQLVSPRPEELRFQALLNEPIAEPGRRGVVAGTSALLVKDRRTGQCFVAITIGNAMGLSPAACDQ
jgi:ABC-type cobalamin transport system permease subunit